MQMVAVGAERDESEKSTIMVFNPADVMRGWSGFKGRYYPVILIDL